MAMPTKSSRLQIRLLAELVKTELEGATSGAPHGMCSTLKNQVNSELLAFFKGKETAASA